MALTSGQIGSFNRSIGVRIDMDEAIYILPVDDVPYQRWLPTSTTASIKHEWMNEALTGQTDTVATVTGTGPYTVDVTDTAIFRVNDLVHVQDAAAGVQFVVTSITDSNTMVLTAFAGNATAPVAADVLEIVGQYVVEGGDPDTMRSQERTGLYNYTQIGQEKVEATRTARKRAMFAQTDPYDHEVSKKFRELAIRFERTLVHGQRSISGDGKQRSMGGTFFYLATNTVSDVKANAKDALNTLIRDCWAAGGAPTTLWCSPAVKAAITANVDAALRRTDTSDTVGGFVVDKLMTDFGTVEIIPNRYFPKTKAVLAQREFNSIVTFDGYSHELLSKTGDGDKGEIVGEFTYELKNENAQGVLTLTDAA